MKNIVIYGLVSLISLGVGAGTVYAVKGAQRSREDAKNKANVQEETGFDKTINALLSAKEMKADSVNVRLSIPTYEDIRLKIADLDVDMSAISDLTALQLKGSLNVKYGSSIDDNLGFIYENGGNLYLTYDNKGYTFNAPTTINGVLNVLNTLNIKLPTSDADASLDMSGLADKALAALKDVPETQTEDGGYSYALNLDDVVKDMGLSGVQGTLYTNENHELKKIALNSDGINYQDKLKVWLGVDGVTLSGENGYTQMSEDQSNKYTDFNNINGVFFTLNKIIDEKKFKAGFALNLRNQSNSLAVSVNGDVRGDLSDAGPDYKKGSYQLNINHVSGEDVLNEASIYHEDETTYLKLNNLVKGRIKNSDIEDIFSLISSEVGSNSTKDIASSLNKIIAGSDLDKLIHQKDFALYKSFINSLDRVDNTIILKLNAKAFGLGGDEIEIRLTSTLDGGLESLSIAGFEYKGYQVDFSLDIEDFVGFEEIDKSLYQDYHQIVPIFNTIVSLVDEKKVSANYSLSVSDDKKSIAAVGQIDADLTGFNKDEKKFGDYHISLDVTKDKKSISSSSLDAYYQQQALYLGYGEILKNSVSNAEMNDIFALFSDKTGGSVDASMFTEISSAIETIKTSEKLQNDLSRIKDSYSLKPLDSFVSIDFSKTNSVDLKVDLSYILEGTALLDQVEGITLSLNTDDDSLTGISIHDLSFKGKKIDFTLDLEKMYREESKLTEEEKESFVPIDSASEMISTFMNVPTQLEKFNVAVNGTLTDTSKTSYQDITMSADAVVDISDKNKPSLGGNVTIVLPPDKVESKYTTEKIEFTYGGVKDGFSLLDGQFNVEYNDNMHIMLEKSTITDIVDIVNSRTEANVLNRYLNDSSAIVTGMPVVDAFMNKDYTSLLNDYIKKVEFGSNTISLSVLGTLFGEENTPENPCHTNTITVTLDLDELTIKAVELDAGLDNYEITGSVEFNDYDESKLPDILAYNEANKSKFVDVNSLKTLVRAGIATTEHNYFELSADLNINMSLLSLNLSGLSTYAKCQMYIENNEVYCYLSFNNKNNTINNSGFYGTEFFIHEDEVYTTRTLNDSGSKSAELRKITQKEMLKNLPYYLLEYILNISSMRVAGIGVGNIVLGNIYGAEKKETGNTLKRDFSKVINKMEYSDGTFLLDANVNSILGSDITDYISINSLIAKIFLNTTSYELEGMKIDVGASVVSIIAATATLNVYRNFNVASSNWSNSRYVQFINKVTSDYGTFDDDSELGCYEITKITANPHWLYKFNGVEITDNGAYQSFGYSSGNYLYFFGYTA